MCGNLPTDAEMEELRIIRLNNSMGLTKKIKKKPSKRRARINGIKKIII